MPKKTGFALLTPEERAKLGRRGGKRAHKNGTAHEFAEGEEAEEAGRRGGHAAHAKRRGKDDADK